MLDSIVSDGPLLNVACSLTDRSWRWRGTDDRAAYAITQRHELPDMVGRLLASRGVSVETAADFLTPTLRALMPDPAVLTDMAPAAGRLAQAVRAGETVAVFGDYDVDGACSAALISGFLRGLGCTVITYVPDRMAEGYGPNAAALARLVDQGARLVVCVDCGTSAHDALAVLAGRADVVILDHHKADGVSPPVLATVNPNRLDCRSGLEQLCASGVAFMATVATLRVLRRDGFFAGPAGGGGARTEPDMMALLDLVALATVCDMMKLTGLNRALVAQGLRVMARRARPGLAALLDVAQTREAPTAMTCGFALGPRINAGGRISEADLGLRLLLCDDAVEARLLAERLDAVNRQRQTVEAGVLQAAIDVADAQMQAGRCVLVVSGARWHPGVVGIVAGRLRERFNRPVCVGGLAGDSVRGSGRSVPGHDLGAAVIAARRAGILQTGGGHAMAAGFSLSAARLDDFQAFLCARMPVAADAPRRPHLQIEAMLSAGGGATTELAGHLARLAPFGAGNEEPVIAVPDVRVVKADRLGNDGNTVRAYVQSEGDGRRLKVLLFKAGEGALGQALLAREGKLHLAGHLRAETWNGNTTAGFVLVDAAMAG